MKTWAEQFSGNVWEPLMKKFDLANPENHVLGIGERSCVNSGMNYVELQYTWYEKITVFRVYPDNHDYYIEVTTMGGASSETSYHYEWSTHSKDLKISSIINSNAAIVKYFGNLA